MRFFYTGWFKGTCFGQWKWSTTHSSPLH